MSTCYVSIDEHQRLIDIPFDELKNFDSGGVKRTISEHDTEDSIALVDENGNYLWAYKDGGFCRYGCNDPDDILDVLSGHFGVEFVSEHDDLYQELFNDEESEDNNEIEDTGEDE